MSARHLTHAVLTIALALAFVLAGCGNHEIESDPAMIDAPSGGGYSDSSKLPAADSNEPYRPAGPTGYFDNDPYATGSTTGTTSGTGATSTVGTTTLSGPQNVGTSTSTSTTIIADPVVDTGGPSWTGGNIHVAAKGDTYWSLAKKYYGDGQQWRRIAEANPAVPHDKIKIGTRLLIPQ